MGRVNTLAARLMALVVAASLGWNCAGIKYTADYKSQVRHEALPLRATVTVLVAPSLREDREDDPNRLEAIRESFGQALRRDLLENGPLTPVVEDPDARLEVTLVRMQERELMLWVMMWFFAPTWLLGVPMHSASLDLGLRVKLTSARGDVLYETTQESTCSRLEGIYYGHEPLTFGCPAKEIAEILREQISVNRSDILARVERDRPRLPAARPILAAAGPAPIAAVFHIRDMSQKLEPQAVDQLTEFLATQVAAQLGFKVVPREQLRGQIVKAKAESWSACYDESCQIELGKAVAASKSVSTTLIRLGTRCAFNVTVFDLKTEAADRAASVDTTCEESALLDAVKRAVGELGRAK